MTRLVSTRPISPSERAAWEAPLHAYLDELEANPVPEVYVYSTKEAFAAGRSAGYRSRDDEVRELAWEAYARGLADALAAVALSERPALRVAA